MLEDDPLGASDDGTFVPFTDMLFNVVIGLAFMVFIAFALINPTAKTGAIEMKAELLITMNWPDYDPNDMDIYVQDPEGNIVWYQSEITRACPIGFLVPVSETPLAPIGPSTASPCDAAIPVTVGRFAPQAPFMSRN